MYHPIFSLPRYAAYLLSLPFSSSCSACGPVFYVPSSMIHYCASEPICFQNTSSCWILRTDLLIQKRTRSFGHQPLQQRERSQWRLGVDARLKICPIRRSGALCFYALPVIRIDRCCLLLHEQIFKEIMKDAQPVDFDSSRTAWYSNMSCNQCRRRVGLRTHDDLAKNKAIEYHELNVAAAVRACA